MNPVMVVLADAGVAIVVIEGFVLNADQAPLPTPAIVAGEY